MSRMDKVLEVDKGSKTVSLQAGARWADVDQVLEKHGLSLSTSPSSKFSTVGGWLATGGMGLNSFSMGHVKESIAAIEIVTPSGAVKGLTPRNEEFHAVFGSEGQLGVITAAKLSVRDRVEKWKPHMVVFDSTESALAFAASLASSDVHPAHIVYENPSKFTYINRMLGQNHFRTGHAILVNVEGEASETAFLAFLKNTGVKEEKEYLARYMWNERFFPMKVRKFGPGLLGSEVVVPIRLLAEAIKTATRLCDIFELEPLFEVHFLDDGNGLLLCYYMTDQGNTIRYTMDALKSMLITTMLLDVGARPYSIGIWNYPFSNAEDRSRVEALRKAKSKLDPKGVMNSGKYFSLSGRFAGMAGKFFGPTIMRPVLKTMVVFSPLTSRLMRTFYDFASKRLRPKTRTDLLRIADECAMCGACVSVCPAYLVVGDERVTGRGKLLTTKAMARGAKISKEHADRIFLCMKCKACEQVCQSKLELVSAYELLEKELESEHGKDAAEIEKFIRYTENTKEYNELIERGLVVGAPKHGMGGVSSDI
jgi:FAD/FMN-containing dehydrogenase/ferredoxin